MKLLLPLPLICVLAMTSLAVTAGAEEATVVNVDNFDKAQTDFEFAGIIKLAGGINKLHTNAHRQAECHPDES